MWPLWVQSPLSGDLCVLSMALLQGLLKRKPCILLSLGCEPSSIQHQGSRMAWVGPGVTPIASQPLL